MVELVVEVVQHVRDDARQLALGTTKHLHEIPEAGGIAESPQEDAKSLDAWHSKTV